MSKRYTETLHKRVKKLTNDIYTSSIREAMDMKDLTKGELFNVVLMLRDVKTYTKYPNFGSSDLYNEIKAVFGKTLDEVIEIQEKIDTMYIEGIIALPTKSLEEILFAHERGKILRMPKTIDAIISEISRRSLFEDSSESDPKSKNGAIDESNTKNKQSRTKSKRKRSKSSKS